jgi:microcystin-dependent protein
MPNSYYEDTSATSSTTSVAFTDTQLEYLNKAHLFVKAIKTDGSTEDFTSGFTVSVSGSTTTVDVSGLSLPATTTTIRIFRTTPVDDLLTTFTNASLLRAEELNNATKQLLFALQENGEQNLGAIPLDADNKFNAGSKAIKNVIDPVDGQEVATKAYVDALTSFSTSPTSVPRVYTSTIDAMTTADPNKTLALSPQPLSTQNEMFIVTVGGVVQQPNTDFTVTSDGTTTTLTITNGNTITGNPDVMALAFGNTKSVFAFPVTGEALAASDTPITLKGHASQTADLLNITNSSNTTLAKVAADGDLTCVDVTASGNAAVTGTLSAAATTASSLTVNGATQVNGDLTVTGTATITGGISALPPGAVVPYAGVDTNTLTGFLVCDGTAVSRTTYSTLFDIIGETYGAGDGFTTFNLPNLENRVPVGVTPSKGLGTTGGSETHALTESEMPRHEHSITGTRTFVNNINVENSTEQGNASPNVQSITFTTASVGATTTHTGGSGSGNSDEDGIAHNIMQPYIALKYIIKT